MTRCPTLLTRKPPRTAAGARLTRFQVELREGRERRTRAARRVKIVELLDDWIPCRIERADYTDSGSRVLMVVAVCRPVAEAAAEQFAKELPGYIRRSFKPLDLRPA